MGDRVGRLTVIGAPVTRDGQHSFSMCRCECGVEKMIERAAMRRGAILSCGCYGREQRRKASFSHGRSAPGSEKRKLYQVWASMRQRCENPNDRSFHNYGGRGIKVCSRWADFPNFLADMGECPEGLTLDRKDNGGNYEPGNCRWATRQDQQRNRRTTHIVNVGDERLYLRQAEDRLGLSPGLIGKRMHKKKCSAQEAADYYHHRRGEVMPP